MLLNEIKILRELDRENVLTGSLGDLGRAFRSGSSSEMKATDIDPKLYPMIQKFIAVPNGSMSAPELQQAFGTGEEGIKSIKAAIANVKAVLISMSDVYSLTVRKSEFEPVAKASTLKAGGFDSPQQWLDFIDEKKKNLEQQLKGEISTMTSESNAVKTFAAIKTVATAKAFADGQAKALEKAVIGIPPMDAAKAAKHAEVFLTMLNMMKINCDDAVRLL